MLGSFKIYIIIGIITALISGGGLLYIKHLKSELELAQANNLVLEQTVKMNETTIEALRDNSIRQHEANTRLEERLKNSNDSQVVLLEVLRSHDLTNLAKAKPGLIENRINEGTQKVFDNFERITDK